MIQSRPKSEPDAPARPNLESDAPVEPGVISAAPDLGTLAKVASLANAPFVALLLIAGKLAWALSLAAGAVVSLVMCGMLALMVERMLAGLKSQSHAGMTPVDEASEKFKFAGMVIAKFIVVGLLVYAVVSMHANPMGVLAGFVITQIAIVISAAKRLKKQ